MHGIPEYHVTPRRMSVFTAMVLGGTAIIVSATVCGAGVLCYGLSIVDRRADNFLDLGKAALAGLPELCDSLPPALSDAISDERRPDYASRLKVTPRLVGDEEGRGLSRPVIEVRNNGDEVVSLLAVRAVLLDSRGTPVWERAEYAATPLAICGDWRGPLMPGSVRQVPLPVAARKNRTLSCEVTDVRVWRPDARDNEASGEASARVASEADTAAAGAR